MHSPKPDTESSATFTAPASSRALPDEAVPHLLLAPPRAALRWARSERTRRAFRQAAADALEATSRVVRATRLPTRKQVLDFFSYQLLINAVAWAAGLAAAGLVASFFEAKAYRNLWGVFGSNGRTLVSADDYWLIVTGASFCAGLLMMIFVRQFVLRVVAEVRALRLERARDRGDTKADRAPNAAPASDFEELVIDPEL